MSDRLIISDIHAQGEKKLSRAQQYMLDWFIALIEKSNEVYLLGDFAEGIGRPGTSRAYTVEEFISSPWRKVFPFLKKKNTRFFYANHDPREWWKEHTSLFAERAIMRGYWVSNDGRKFHFEHGHQIEYYILAERKEYEREKKAAKGVIDRLKFAVKDYSRSELDHQKAIKLIRERSHPFVTDFFGVNDHLVLGHFHVPAKFPAEKYYNSGNVIAREKAGDFLFKASYLMQNAKGDMSLMNEKIQ